MQTFQESILDDPDVCSNCFGRQRRAATTPVSRASNADRDADGYPVQDDDGQLVTRFSERIRWQMTVDDVPGPTASKAGTVFCACGAPGAFDRFWDIHDLDLDRFAGMLELLFMTLRAKGHSVDLRPFCRAAREAYLAVPERGEYGPFPAHRPTSINDVFATAVEAGLAPEPEPKPTPSAA